MSQLRQPGDYLKNNRTVPPHVHTFTAEKTRTENKLLTDSFLQATKEDSFPQATREDSCPRGTEADSCP